MNIVDLYQPITIVGEYQSRLFAILRDRDKNHKPVFFPLYFCMSGKFDIEEAVASDYSMASTLDMSITTYREWMKQESGFIETMSSSNFAITGFKTKADCDSFIKKMIARLINRYECNGYILWQD